MESIILLILGLLITLVTWWASMSLEILPVSQEPFKIRQTGFDKVHIDIYRNPLQPVSGKTTDITFASLFAHPKDRTDFDSATELETATPTTWFKVDDTNKHWFDVCLDLIGQAWTGFREISVGNPIDISSNATLGSANCTILGILYKDVERALRRRKPLAMYSVNGVLTASTTLTNNLIGVQWKDQGTGTAEMHVQQLRRMFYATALKYAPPKMTRRIDQTNETTWQRIVSFITFMIVFEVCYTPLLAVMQSDRAVANIAAAADLLNDKIDDSMISSVDEVWSLFAKKNKKDTLSGYTHTGYTAYTGNFIDTDLFDATTLDDSLKLWKKKFVVPSRSLKWAREKYGHGKHITADNETSHFLNLWDGVIEGSSSRTTHGKSTWVLFANTALAFKYLQQLKGTHRDMLNAITEQASWTWDEFKNITKDFWVDFTFAGSLKGVIGDNNWHGVKNQVYFEDADISGAEGITSDVPDAINTPNLIHTTGTLKVAITTSGVLNCTWAYAFIQEYINDEYRLCTTNSLTLEEVMLANWYSMLISTAANLGTSWTNNYRYLMNRIQMYTIVDARQRDRKVGLMSATAQQVRMQYLLDHCDYTNYATTAIKNMVGLVDVSHAPMRLFSAPRPKSIDGKTYTILDGFADQKILQEFISGALGTGSKIGKDTTKSVVEDTNSNTQQGDNEE